MPLLEGWDIHEYDEPVCRLSYEEACSLATYPPTVALRGRAIILTEGTVLRLWRAQGDHMVYEGARIDDGHPPWRAEAWKIELEAAQGAPITT